MTSRALITGATSGIGRAFANELAKERADLVLVARNRERLDQAAAELESTYGIKTEVIQADLSEKQGVEAVYARLQDETSPIDMLVNNAGFGSGKSFTEMTAADHEDMLRVNVEAVVVLAHAAVSAMVKRGNGDVINVASVAGFLPGLRGSATYAATKAFVTAFTEGLAPVTRGTGVRVSALCPGFVKTEFHERAGMKQKKQNKLLWLDAGDVARTGLIDHRKGRLLSIPSPQYKVIVAVARLAPRALILRTMSRMGKSSKR
jgi:short-subunit dehydrogenase